MAREKNESRKAKLQAKLTQVQQQIRLEKDQRSKEAWEKQQKARPYLLCSLRNPSNDSPVPSKPLHRCQGMTCSRLHPQHLQAKERELVKAGKKPFYQKQSDKRKAEMLRKYNELEATGQLEKFMAKRRKKNAAKDHRLLPSKRRET